LADAGLSLTEMDPTASLWQAGAWSHGITGSTCYARFRRYLRAAGLPPTGLHILHHSAAKLKARRRRVDRVGLEFSRPLIARGDVHLPPAS
jgi:hypothetical protein